MPGPSDNPPAGRAGRAWRIAGPWALSLVLHGALVWGLFFIAWTILSSDPEKPRVIASFDEIGMAAMEQAPDTEDTSTRAAEAPEQDSPAAPEAPSLSDLLAESAPSAAPSVPEPAPIDQMLELTRRRSVPDVRFAGLGASNARDVVFVVDASGSMVSTFPVVLAELERSVRRLEPTQRFQILFFGPSGQVAARHPADPADGVRMIRLIRATTRNVAHALAWARSVLPSGSSDPIGALELALGLEPDAVFVLSREINGVGEWLPTRPEILSRIDSLNPVDQRNGRRRVLIKTIGLIDEDRSGVLEALGAAHGGEDGYNFISREELPQR